MTNEQAKQEAIKKAYGKWFFELEDLINKYGTVTRMHVPNNLQNIFGDFFWDNQDGEYWPKTITGLYKNNGWIRIEPDGSNLPKYSKDQDGIGVCHQYKFLNNESDFTCDMYYPYKGIFERDILNNYTHYKPIKPELKPIY